MVAALISTSGCNYPRASVPPISSSYSGCGKLVKELEIEKRH
jgi:hypothetical protein